MTDDLFKQKVLTDLAVLKADMHKLVGNGQPGRMTKLEDRVWWITLAVVGLILGSGGPALMALIK